MRELVCGTKLVCILRFEHLHNALAIRLVEMLASTRNSISPRIIKVIEKMNSVAMAADRSEPVSSPKNRVTITRQTSRAANADIRRD